MVLVLLEKRGQVRETVDVILLRGEQGRVTLVGCYVKAETRGADVSYVVLAVWVWFGWRFCVALYDDWTA